MHHFSEQDCHLETKTHTPMMSDTGVILIAHACYPLMSTDFPPSDWQLTFSASRRKCFIAQRPGFQAAEHTVNCNMQGMVWISKSSFTRYQFIDKCIATYRIHAWAQINAQLWPGTTAKDLKNVTSPLESQLTTTQTNQSRKRYTSKLLVKMTASANPDALWCRQQHG